MKNLDFLAGFQLDEAPVVSTGGSSGPRLQRRPDGDADLRVFKNGRVYPSEAFQDKYALEHVTKHEEIDPIGGDVTTTVLGNGLDVIDSVKWVMASKLPERVVFIAITPRQGNGKIDLFGSTQYDDNLQPKKLIMDAGPSTFGKEVLVPLLAEVFGIDWEKVPHVDINVITDMPISHPTQVYVLPKTVARGADKGKDSYVRREKIDIFPITVVEPKEVVGADQIIDEQVKPAMDNDMPTRPESDLLESRDEAPSDANPIETAHSEAPTMGNPLDTIPENTQEVPEEEEGAPMTKRNVLDELGLN